MENCMVLKRFITDAYLLTQIYLTCTNCEYSRGDIRKREVRTRRMITGERKPGARADGKSTMHECKRYRPTITCLPSRSLLRDTQLTALDTRKNVGQP